MRIFEDDENFVVRNRARISFDNELKLQGLEKCRENKNCKLETDIFSSDIYCMRSKIKDAINAKKKGIV